MYKLLGRRHIYVFKIWQVIQSIVRMALALQDDRSMHQDTRTSLAATCSLAHWYSMHMDTNG